MPVCKKFNCNQVQNKLNKGGLCKNCFHKKIHSHNEQPTKDQSILSDTQSSIVEKKRDIEVIELLKENITYLKNDIMQKNKLIQDLINKLPSGDLLLADNNRVVRNTKISTSTTSNESNNSTLNTDNTSCVENANIDLENTATSEVPINSDLRNWQPVNVNVDLPSPIKSHSSVQQHRTIVEDRESDFDKVVENAHIRQHKVIRDVKNKYNLNNGNQRSTSFANQHPENDLMTTEKPFQGIPVIPV